MQVSNKVLDGEGLQSCSYIVSSNGNRWTDFNTLASDASERGSTPGRALSRIAHSSIPSLTHSLTRRLAVATKVSTAARSLK